MTGAPLSIVKGIRTGTDLVQSARLSQELQKILLPTNPNVVDIVHRNNKESLGIAPKTYRLDSSGQHRNLLASQSSLGADHAYEDKPYESAGHRGIGRARGNRYEIASKKLTESKVSAPNITGPQLINAPTGTLLQMNGQLVSPGASCGNPIKRRFESDMVPFSTICKLIFYAFADLSLTNLN